MDALSEALNSVHMTGAIFYHAECTAPWGFRVPHVQSVAHMLAPEPSGWSAITSSRKEGQPSGSPANPTCP